MEYALLRCCVTGANLTQYEASTDAVLNALGVSWGEIKEFNCCGYPLKNVDFNAHALLSARNLALAEKHNAGLTTLCNCCYGSVTHIDHLLKEDTSFKNNINEKLKKESLQYNGRNRVKHLFEILYEDIGIDQIKEKIVTPFHNLRIAVHYGCHLIRPDKMVRFEKTSAKAIFDELVEALGAESVEWSRQVECCGSPLWGINDELSMDLTQKKIADAIDANADYLCVACPFCQLQFDRVQNTFMKESGDTRQLPVILYSQLLGLCLGIDEAELGIDQNETDISEITNFATVTQQ